MARARTTTGSIMCAIACLAISFALIAQNQERRRRLDAFHSAADALKEARLIRFTEEQELRSKVGALTVIEARNRLYRQQLGRADAAIRQAQSKSKAGANNPDVLSAKRARCVLETEQDQRTLEQAEITEDIETRSAIVEAANADLRGKQAEYEDKQAALHATFW